MKMIVSITPIAVASDSRTYKMAASFSRFGYKSIVVEGLRSNFHSNDLPFELRDVKGEIIFTKANGREESFKKPARFAFELFQYWFLRLTKPFSNQWRTFRTLPKASLYYLHSFYQFPAVFLKSKLLGVSYIYDAHDFYPVVSPGKFNDWMERQCVRFAAKVVTVSSGVAELIEKEYDRSPIVIRNCHDTRLESEPAQDLRKILKLSQEDFLIVVVGQAKDGMAVPEVLEALCELPSNVHLAFVGKNTGNYLKFVEQFQLAARVHLVPPVLPDQVVPFIKNADAAMIIYYPRSSNYENCLPNGFFQSVSACLPLVYSNLPELRRIAEKYEIGISIDSQSPKEMREGLLQLLQNAGLRQSYKQNLEVARQELSWVREENVLRGLVEQTLLKHTMK